MRRLRTIVLGLTAALLVACGGGSATPLSDGVPSPTVTVPSAPTIAAPVTATPASVVFTNANWPLAITDADRYKGSPVTLLGKIFLEPERTAEYVAFQMYADPANNAQNTVVAGLPPTSNVKRGDYVKVVGTIYDMLEGTNALNAKVRIPRIRADSVVSVARADVVAPTIRALNMDQPQTQFGVTITLQKVEFAKSETRFFVRVANAGPAKASVYEFNAIVVQGSKQLKAKSVYDADYPDIPSGMLAGVTAETVLLFDALEIAPLRFVWSASSDNYSQRFQDYQWAVAP